MDKHSVTADVAADEFERFAEAMDLDLDPATLDAEEAASLARLRRTFERAVMAGKLSVDGEGRPVLHADGVDLVFREPTGATIMEMDKVKRGDVAKTHAILKSMCQVDPAVFAKLPSRYYKIAQAIVALFLG